MAGKKYEKYVVRQAMRPQDFLDPMAAEFYDDAAPDFSQRR